MAIPGRKQTFGYTNCRDLVEKLDREIDRYREVAGNDEELEPEALLNLVHQLMDSAFNASVTAWQISDWVFNDLKPQQRCKLGFKKSRCSKVCKGAMQSIVSLPTRGDGVKTLDCERIC